MKKFDTAFFAVYHPAVQRFFSFFMDSLERQSVKDFDLVLFIDNCEPLPFEPSMPMRSVRLHTKRTPAEIRQMGWDYLLSEGYSDVIFGDVDDYFSVNRIERSRGALKDDDFVFNDLILIDEKGGILIEDYVQRAGAEHKGQSCRDIVHENWFGLSNTAVKVECLKGLTIPENVMSVDWWLFTMFLIEGRRGHFLKDVKTYYRQHAESFVGIAQAFNATQLSKLLQVKKKHYEWFTSYSSKHHKDELASLFNAGYQWVLQIDEKIKHSEYRDHLIHSVQEEQKEGNFGWWGELSFREAQLK